MSDDPFEDLDADRDPEEDPFERLDAETDDEQGPDPFEGLDAPDGADGSGASDTRDDRGDRSVDVAGGPFGDVDLSRGDAFESAESPFERVDVSGVDPDEVWERFAAEADAADAAEATDADPSTGADDVVTVPKDRFCETCPHFSAPPEVQCGHEGTRVLEFVGTDDVRVSNCPIVRERRELGEVHD